MHFGKVNYCINNAFNHTNPKDMIACDFSGVIDGNNHGLSTNLRNVVIGEKEGAMSGKYYLGIRAQSHAGLSIAFLEKNQI